MGYVCGDIMQYIEGIAPLRLAEEYDNVGLILGSKKQAVQNLMVCLDITHEVAKEAESRNVDLIVSHHPLIFKGMKKLHEDEYKGNILYRLIRIGISVYAAHTNLDITHDGLNDWLAQKLELREIQNLKDYKTLPLEMPARSYGLGKLGTIEKEMSQEAFIGYIKEKLEIEHVRVIGQDFSQVIRKVAVFCGSFDDDLKVLKDQKVDILVTGDLKYHTATDALAMGLHIIDAGHFGTEKLVVEKLVQKLSANFKGVHVFGSSVEKDPFTFV